MTESRFSRFLSKLRNSVLKRLRIDRPNDTDRAFLARMPEAHRARLAALLRRSQSQICQDLFALSVLGFKRDGFFVEFGAADGRGLSNTWLLEKHFGWRGILSEPARSYAPKLRSHRACTIDHRCVWSRTGEMIAFREASNRVLSTIAIFSEGDMHAEARKDGVTYDVPTISLGDLLTEHGAPRDPDFLSIDTEGSELAILSALDFDRWSFKVICCEHAYTEARGPLFELLSVKGYVRVHQEISQYDDWYVRRDVLRPEGGAVA